MSKPLFLGTEYLRYARSRFLQLRIRILHQIANRKDHFMKKRFRLSEQSSMRDGSTNDLPQHIPAAFVRRQHTIGNQKSRRAGMISNHSQGSSGFLLGWADEGVRPSVVRAAACVGAGALPRPAARSSAPGFGG